MKNAKLMSKWISTMCVSFSFIFLIFLSCESSDIDPEKIIIYPPDFSKEFGMTSFQPDSGVIATQLIIKGFNLGADTSYIKVAVNGKNARVVGVKDNYVHAIVPARADTGFVTLTVGKGENAKTFTSDKEFIYLFKRNVTSYAGLYDKSGRVDGPLEVSRFQRPWAIKSDKDGALWVIDEGRGTDKNGALRKIYDGLVETIAQNTTGPFQSPTDLAFSKSEDTLFVCNKQGGGLVTDARIIYATRDGNFMTWRNLLIEKDFNVSTVEVNPVTGELFFNNTSDGCIYKYVGGEKRYEKLHQINNSTNVECRIKFSNDGKKLAIASRNRHVVYVADYDINTKTMSTPVLLAGQWGEANYRDGIGAQAILDQPVGVAWDEDGNVFIGERHNHVVRKITPDGQTIRWAGKPREWGNKDGLPDVAMFRDPEGVCITAEGVMFVCDMGGHIIRRVVVE